MTQRSHDPLPLGVALLLLGAGAALLTFMSLSADNVGFERTRWTALLAMVLAAPAILLYVLRRGPPNLWWRAFWTVALIAYLMHFWWAVFVIYDGNVEAIIARQGFVAYTNFAVTILWTLDVVAAWITARGRAPLALTILHFVTWAGVTASFLAASIVFRSDAISVVGYVLAVGVFAAILARFGHIVRIPAAAT
jgi:hypothetical protein